MRPDSQVLADVAIAAVKSVTGPLLERIAVLEQRNADLSARLQEFAGVRDRLVAVEVKSSMPVPVPDVAPVLERLALFQERLTALETTKESPLLLALREDIKALQPRQEAPSNVSERVLELERVQAWRASSDEVLTKHVSEARDHLAAFEKETLRTYADLKERVAVLESRPVVAGPPGPPGEPGAPGKDGRDGDATLPYQGVYQEAKEYSAGQMVTWGGSMWHCNQATTAKPGESKDWTLIVKKGRDGRDGKDAPTLPVVGVK